MSRKPLRIRLHPRRALRIILRPLTTQPPIPTPDEGGPVIQGYKLGREHAARMRKAEGPDAD